MNTLDAPIFASCLQETIEQHGIAISMDGKNRALDTIYVEHLGRSLKYEDIYIKQYEPVRELREGIARYFRFYNPERFHQEIGYLTPDEMYQSFHVVDLADQAA